MSSITTAKEAGLLCCHTCNKLTYAPADIHQHINCHRCDSDLHMRKPNSLNRTWALLITSIILFIPANTYPIMSVVTFGKAQPDTIASGIMTLIKLNMHAIALVVFVASILVPFLKMLAIFIILLSIQFKWNISQQQRTVMYRLIELVGRWSMLDLFVIAILVALVDLKNLAEIEAGVGSTAFGLVVITTMFAAMAFDPRLIWDKPEK